jgi:hypothetical protein
VLDQFKLWIQSNNLDFRGEFDDYDLLRFCRARKFVLNDVKQMFKSFVNWRTLNNVDLIVKPILTSY